jgi:hypothetical protein
MCKDEPAIIYLYQTGLDAAIVGIYRAVTERLLTLPGSVVVIPRYFRRQAPDAPGARRVGGYEQQSSFQESRNPWGC